MSNENNEITLAKRITTFSGLDLADETQILNMHGHYGFLLLNGSIDDVLLDTYNINKIYLREMAIKIGREFASARDKYQAGVLALVRVQEMPENDSLRSYLLQERTSSNPSSSVDARVLLPSHIERIVRDDRFEFYAAREQLKWCAFALMVPPADIIISEEYVSSPGPALFDL